MTSLAERIAAWAYPVWKDECLRWRGKVGVLREGDELLAQVPPDKLHAILAEAAEILAERASQDKDLLPVEVQYIQDTFEAQAEANYRARATRIQLNESVNV